jgi:hypothetical protein
MYTVKQMDYQQYLYNLYKSDILMYMTIISTSKARSILPSIIENITERDNAYVIGRRNKPEVIIIKFPTQYRKDVSEITNINANSSSFSFLNNEPDIYSLNDIVK